MIHNPKAKDQPRDMRFVHIQHLVHAMEVHVISHQGVCSVHQYHRYPLLVSNAVRDARVYAKNMAVMYGLNGYTDTDGQLVYIEPIKRGPQHEHTLPPPVVIAEATPRPVPSWIAKLRSALTKLTGRT